jgi:thiamine biosynthesis lipoprotein
MAADLHVSAMGSDAHVIVVGGAHPARLLDLARLRLDDLEARWSRFRPDSEVSRLTAAAGTPVGVSPETVELVQRSIRAWRLTGGLFDPTVLGALVQAGYDRTFTDLPAAPPTAPRPPAVAGVEVTDEHAEPIPPGSRPLGPHDPGAEDIVVDGGQVTLPSGTGFDPGGIGKGLAADLVARELMAAGAAGACVNLGGDIRLVGEGDGGDAHGDRGDDPDSGDGSTAEAAAWTVDVEHPRGVRPLARLGLHDGAVATSTTLRRRWAVARGVHHHLIDPLTGRPSASDLTLATAIAREAWVAEVMAKAVLLRGSRACFDLVDGTGVEALAVHRDGWVVATAGFRRFTGGHPLPLRLEEAA